MKVNFQKRAFALGVRIGAGLHGWRDLWGWSVMATLCWDIAPGSGLWHFALLLLIVSVLRAFFGWAWR